MATGGNSAELDFASVQRGNAEIQRRHVVGSPGASGRR
jgi:phosphoribosylformylglycinamidine (FGAM) synthase-like enzyme